MSKPPSNVNGRKAAIDALKKQLAELLAKDRKKYFGNIKESFVKYAENYHWDESQQTFRLIDLNYYGFVPASHGVLDISAGCGQFLSLALKANIDILGIEPETWKIVFFKKKVEIMGWPEEWADKVIEGRGESLPFEDDSFDFVTSWQTLEHVQNPKKVIAEMVRVTRVGGGIILRCPDYRSTFEGHYRLPWLPLFPRSAAKVYLRILGRPVDGLSTIQYVTKPRILRWFDLLKNEGVRFAVINHDRVLFENKLRSRGIPRLPGIYGLWLFLRYLKNIGRHEISVRLFVRILEK